MSHRLLFNDGGLIVITLGGFPSFDRDSFGLVYRLGAKATAEAAERTRAGELIRAARWTTIAARAALRGAG
ncbi:hypothetical protein [Sorangium sp. So ce1000]|uniref:hypothetical protein n=1 Tax=Sorangium sp. So ce1000 TaxID=3133325 RepID=UPI003F5FC73D